MEPRVEGFRAVKVLHRASGPACLLGLAGSFDRTCSVRAGDGRFLSRTSRNLLATELLRLIVLHRQCAAVAYTG